MNFKEFFILKEDPDSVNFNGDKLTPISPYATAFGILNTKDNPVFKGLDNLDGKLYVSEKGRFHADFIQELLTDIKKNKTGSISFEKDGKSYKFDAASKDFNVLKLTQMIPWEYHRVKLFNPCGRFWNNPTNKFGGPYYVFSFWNPLVDDNGNANWNDYQKILDYYKIPQENYNLLKFEFPDYNGLLDFNELQREFKVTPVKNERSKDKQKQIAIFQSKKHLIGGLQDKSAKGSKVSKPKQDINKKFDSLLSKMNQNYSSI